MTRKRVILFILSTLLVNQYSQAGQIDELLSKYEESADLSNKTRTESLGHYIVITRKDLDTMQAYTLSDVLKSLKLHTYIPNRFGVYQLTPAGFPPAINTSYRLFIDNHEVSSIHTDNPFLIFDNYPLDGINHIEVYYGSGAVRTGNEPSLFIIKLYTKEPSRENTGVARLSISNRKDYTFSYNDARVIKPNISYNLMVNHSVLDFRSYQVDGKQISRDIYGNYLFFKFNYFDTTLDISYIGVKRDAYGGIAADFSPDISKTKSEDIYINLSQNLLDDKSLKLNLSIDMNRRKGEFSNDIGGGGVFIGWLYPYPVNPLKIPLYYYEDRDLNKYTFYISKEFKTDKNVLLVGGSYKIKENNINSIRFTTPSESKQLSQLSPLRKVELMTVFLENQYNITEKNLLFTSLKYDYNKRDGGYSDISGYIGRLGFVSFLSENLYLKGFLTKTYIPPSFFEVEMSGNLTQIKKKEIQGASFEINYNKDNQSLNLFYGYIDTKNMIVFNPYAQNSGKHLTAHIVSIDYQYKFDNQKKVLLNLYKTFNNFDDFSSTDGGSIKIYTSTDNFDVYNEVIYRKGFKVYGKDIDDSFNYNVAIKYKFIKNFTVGIKGENLLNSSANSVFTTTKGSVILPSFDKRFIVNIEKVF